MKTAIRFSCTGSLPYAKYPATPGRAVAGVQEGEEDCLQHTGVCRAHDESAIASNAKRVVRVCGASLRRYRHRGIDVVEDAYPFDLE